jgi:uncharacterized GH25 family protein
MHPIVKWTALTLAVCLPLSAQAHRAWMLPSATVLSGEDPWITVDAAISNDLFYFEHFPMRLKDIGDISTQPAGQRARQPAVLKVMAPDGSEVKPQNGAIGRYRTTFDVHLLQKGTYKLAIANQGLFASWKENGEAKRWMGEPEAFAKQVPAQADELKVTQHNGRMEVFVTSGAPTETVLKPTGQGLELAPLTHPNDLFAGEAADFVMLLDGQPAADVEISVIPGGNRYRDDLGEINTRTDAKGKFSVTWPNAGMYWLEAELTTDKDVKAPATERRASYSATLEVQAP